ncbi:DUF4365 domain-containing protein [Rhizobium sp. IBUN]|uniref:DUF4365 domain-containing protein n=1 Tax=Rhizobium sp. IBUN TaxID=1042326 RepID=UPI000409C3D8|nr:DUF4365 domain-containing protein [Rhizobium sp. IBUN]
MAKSRVDNHLKEDASELLVSKLLPEEWVIRKLHPDYGVDVTIEVFEREGQRIPTLGEFLFVQLKSTTSLTRGVEPIRRRGNVEKALDAQDIEADHELDVVRFAIDTDTVDNARLMGPSTPLMLFVCDLSESEVYYVCLTDYYDKIIEPRGIDLSGQGTITVLIPAANKLTDARSAQVMQFYAARAKLYGMFNLAQFQYREARCILQELARHEYVENLASNFAMIERFARRLRAMPIWERDIPWQLMRDYRARLDLIIKNIEADTLGLILRGLEAFIKGDDAALTPLKQFHGLCTLSWEQFSAIGQTFEDIVREWFLPTWVGQLGSGEEPHFREIQSLPSR